MVTAQRAGPGRDVELWEESRRRACLAKPLVRLESLKGPPACTAASIKFSQYEDGGFASNRRLGLHESTSLLTNRSLRK